MNPYRPFHPSQLRDSGRFSLHFPYRLKLQAASFPYHVRPIIANVFLTAGILLVDFKKMSYTTKLTVGA
jgi:hypothetical protein